MSVTAARKLLAAPVASGSFVPTDIAGCSSWLDASDTSSITATSGDVDTWADKSGNGNDATWPGAGYARIVTGTRTLNTLNALDLSGGRFVWFTPTSVDATIFFVGQLDGTGVTRRMISCYDGAGGLTSGEWIFDWLSTGSVRFLRGSTSTARTLAQDLTTTHVFVAQNSASASKVRVDGSDTTGSGYSTAPVRTLHIGEDNSGAPGGIEAWDGRVGEIIYYEAVLTGAQIATVEDYLSTKWGTP